MARPLRIPCLGNVPRLSGRKGQATAPPAGGLVPARPVPDRIVIMHSPRSSRRIARGGVCRIGDNRGRLPRRCCPVRAPCCRVPPLQPAPPGGDWFRLWPTRGPGVAAPRAVLLNEGIIGQEPEKRNNYFSFSALFRDLFSEVGRQGPEKHCSKGLKMPVLH